MPTATSNRGEPAGKATFYKSFHVMMLVAAIGFAGLIVYATIDSGVRPLVSTSHYHFNVQYRAGNETAMNEVVNNSLIPILQMYARHPAWKANIEFQGLMLDWMNRMNDTTRKTSVVNADTGVMMYELNGMDLLRYLVHRKQIQIIVIQYSDALALAYPYIDFYKSINHTRALLADLGIINETDTSAVSRAVLLQEGQFMLGASRQAKDFRLPPGSGGGGAGSRAIYDTFLTTRESLSYFGVTENAPLYTYSTGGEQIYILPYNPVPSIEGGVLHHILWFQDGENVNAGEGETWSDVGFINNTDDYYHFPPDPEKQWNHERRLMDLEEMGNQFLTLDEWVQYLVDRNEVRPLGRWVPETHWSVFRYRSSFIWMGETVGGTAYDDSEINARNYQVHKTLLAAEVLLNWSHGLGAPSDVNDSYYQALYKNLTRAWLDLAEAQVTDSTGLGPRDYEGRAAILFTTSANATAWHVMDAVINATPALFTQLYTMHGSIQVLPSNLGTASPLVINGSAIAFTPTGAVASISNLTSAGVGIELKNHDDVAITHVQLETQFNPTIQAYNPAQDGLLNGTQAYSIRVHFPRTNSSAFPERWTYAKFTGDFAAIKYTASLWEREGVTTPLLRRSDYNIDKVDYYKDWDEEILDNFEIYLALSNGMVWSPANGGMAIIKNCSTTHVCAKWNTGDIRFMQTETRSGIDPSGQAWQFYVLTGVSVNRAIAFANLVNTDAPLILSEANFK
ncbi:MAG: hypothetical protein GYA24_09925 [Candidatus Lokiarchaeota archaeon]|nr:hypothetical protein [Candidatus Lokiarchaeota archaeon]